MLAVISVVAIGLQGIVAQLLTLSVYLISVFTSIPVVPLFDCLAIYTSCLSKPALVTLSKALVG
jgi:hypothetical protein